MPWRSSCRRRPAHTRPRARGEFKRDPPAQVLRARGPLRAASGSGEDPTHRRPHGPGRWRPRRRVPAGPRRRRAPGPRPRRARHAVAAIEARLPGSRCSGGIPPASAPRKRFRLVPTRIGAPRTPELGQVAKEEEVVAHGLPEADSGIDPDAVPLDARRHGALDAGGERGDDLGDDVVVARVDLHRLRRPLDVHQHQRRAGVGHRARQAPGRARARSRRSPGPLPRGAPGPRPPPCGCRWRAGPRPWRGGPR